MALAKFLILLRYKKQQILKNFGAPGPNGTTPLTITDQIIMVPVLG